MVQRVARMVRRRFYQLPLMRSWKVNQQFKVERALLKGRYDSQSTHKSIIHFSINKAATQYTKQILSRCAQENGLTIACMSDYAWQTDFPYLFKLSAVEVEQYLHIFRPTGFLYTVFGELVEGIPNIDDYRLVLMVRDPRDVLISSYYSYAYSHPVPKANNKRESFNGLRSWALQTGLDEFVMSTSDDLLRVYKRYMEALVDRPGAFVARYEDMIMDFPTWLDNLLQYCELEISAQLRQQLLQESNKSRPSNEDVSKHRRQVMPGEHKKRLKPETIVYLNDLFSNVLEKLNYAARL